MKTFEDLVFKQEIVCKHAVLYFENGYGISVLFGDKVYSNGIDTYEVAMLYKNDFFYIEGDSIIPYATKEKINEIMIELQNKI